MSKEARTQETGEDIVAPRGGEEEEAVEEKVPKQRRVLRITAIIPAILSVAACVLIILLVVSGTKPGVLEDYELLRLNTSKLGQDLVQFTPTTSNPTATTTTAPSTTNPLDALESWLSGLLNDTTTSIDSGLNDAEAALIASVLDELGIQDFYSLHILDMCSGGIDGSKFNTSECIAYSDPSPGLSNLTTAVPTSFTLLTTNVSVPILDSISQFSVYIGSTTQIFSKTIFAFYLIAVIASFIVLLGSLAGIFASTSRMLVYVNLGFSILGSTFQLTASLAATIMISLIVSVANQFGDAIGLRATQGKNFLIVTSVIFVLVQIVNWYWFAVWWVEVRKSAFKKRRRTEEQVGNWKGIWGEMKSDLKIE